MKKHLLIFGANGYLGKGITETFSKKNYDRIYLFDFKFDQATSEEHISQHLIKDLSVEENVTEAFSHIEVNKTDLYFLYSTIGGYFGGKKLWETGIEDFQRMISMNLKTNFLIAKHFSGIVKKSSGGSICFTSAYVGQHPEPQKAVYGAAKAAVTHLVRSLAVEGVEIKMSANAIAPYIIDTKENREWMNEKNLEQAIKPLEIGEFISAVFDNFNFISGNIFELKHRFNL